MTGDAATAPWSQAPADFAIGLRPIALNAWFEDSEAPAETRARKQTLLATATDRVWAETPGSRPAQFEASALIATALGQTISGEPPLLTASLEVADDLCLMERREDAWTLTALSLSAGTFFTAREVIGRSLAQLHAPVPGFGRSLLPRVARVFDHLRPDIILERRIWTVVNSDTLHLPDPVFARAELPSIEPEAAGERLFVRIERQTLRRLPETGGLLFTIRVTSEPLACLARDPGRLAAFAQAWRNAAPDFRAYTRLDLYDPLVARFLHEAGVLASGE